MEIALIVVALVALAAFVGWYTASQKLSRSEVSLAQALAERDAERGNHEQRLRELDERFKGLAADVLQSSSEEFRKQAQESFKQQQKLVKENLEAGKEAVRNTVKPVGESLEKFNKQVGEMEKARERAYGEVTKLVDQTRLDLGQLQKTTGGLRQALSSPQQRGRWGELTLERVIEVSGMRAHVDYSPQQTVESDGRSFRPDVVIRMPRGLVVPIDAKTPLEAYLRAHEATDESKQRSALKEHAATLMKHARTLGSKNYVAAIKELSPSFVVLFVPAETILDAAMVVQPGIWEDAWESHQVLIASPGLLIALLRTVGVTWQQEEAQRNAQEIAKSAATLYDRLSAYAEHVVKMGKGLKGAVDAYNKGVGSFQSRVLVQARRMGQLGTVSDAAQIDGPEAIDLDIRPLTMHEQQSSPRTSY